LEGPCKGIVHVLFLQAIRPYIPLKEPELAPAVYEVILHYYLKKDCEVQKECYCGICIMQLSGSFCRDGEGREG